MTLQPNRKSQVAICKSGFTLVELLVVIGIIAVLISLLVPAVMSAMKGGDKTRISLQIQTLSIGLEAYKTDFGTYPRSNETLSGVTTRRIGGAVLQRWLVGAGDNDGTTGAGYRISDRTGAAAAVAKGPYIQANQLRLTQAANNSNTFVFLDAAGNAFYYYTNHRPSNVITSSTPVAEPYVSNDNLQYRAMFCTQDNDSGDYAVASASSLGTSVLRHLLGDANVNGVIDAGESPRFTGAYMIWSPGPSRTYPSDGSDPDPVVRQQQRKVNIDRSTVVSNIPS